MAAPIQIVCAIYMPPSYSSVTKLLPFSKNRLLYFKGYTVNGILIQGTTPKASCVRLLTLYLAPGRFIPQICLWRPLFLFRQACTALDCPSKGFTAQAYSLAHQRWDPHTVLSPLRKDLHCILICLGCPGWLYSIATSYATLER